MYDKGVLRTHTHVPHTHTHTHHTAPPKESLSEHKDHKKMIEKGKPEDAPVGIKHRKVSLHLAHTNVGSCSE